MTKQSKNSEAAIRAWLPEIGEWYQLTTGATLMAFDTHVGALAFYQEKVQNAVHLVLNSSEWLLILNVHVVSENQPCLVDFMIKDEMPQKVHTMPLFPPKNLSHEKIWEVLLERKSA